jgi:glycosyltransferase involved in cell wall biosynthesis
MSKIRIGLFCPIPQDPTSWYRGVGPYTRLARDHSHLELLFLTAIDWTQIIQCDILVMQRPASPEHFALLCLAKDCGVKVIVDFDDDNLSVPKDNPTYHQYNQMPIKEAILRLARHCDVLTVTTQHMKKKYGIYNKNTVIIPNALDDKILHLRQLPQGEREKKLVWRGTLSHQRNLMTVGRQLVSLHQKYPDWKFTFFGCDPIDLTDRIKQSEVIPQVNITDFYKIMCQIHGRILYYPLNSNDHSQARSHISWLEATFGNMQTLAFENDEFKRPGVINFNSPEDFESKMDMIIGGQVDIDKNVQESWNHIQENYLLSKVNKKRLEIVESIMSS